MFVHNVRCKARKCADKKSVQVLEDDTDMGTMCLSSSACKDLPVKGRRRRAARLEYTSIMDLVNQGN